MQDRQFDSANMAFGSIQQINGVGTNSSCLASLGMARGEDLEWTTAINALYLSKLMSAAPVPHV